MIYYIEFQGGKITGKGNLDFDIQNLNANQMSVDKDVYDQLVTMPADFEITPDGEIINIVGPPIPTPQPPPKSDIEILREQVNDMAIAMAAMIGGAV